MSTVDGGGFIKGDDPFYRLKDQVLTKDWRIVNTGGDILLQENTSPFELAPTWVTRVILSGCVDQRYALLVG